MRDRSRRWLVSGLALALVAVTTAAAAPARAAPTQATPAVPGQGIERPRVLYDPGTEGELQDRLTREPYRRVFLTAHQRALSFVASRALGDESIAGQRDLSRAAKILAFEYALDRTVVAGQIVPFPDAAERQAVGDLVRDLLLQLYTRSRLAVPAPLGGFDRDINTSEEIINYATAFDTLLGAGYDLGTDRAVIVHRLAAVTGELYLNYTEPATAGNFATLMQNNHRSKSGAAMAVAAVVLADDVDAAGDWWDYGVREVDDILRHILVTGDGAYGEGPYYYRYTMQNVLPLIGVWERHLGSAAWDADGVVVRAPLHDPLFARSHRWMLDMALPDGTMAAIDDGNPGRSYYYGAVPPELGDPAAGYQRWARTPQPYETDGSIDLSAETIVAYDDTVTPALPSWAPTQFYVEGGDAIFRSDWTPDATVALALGEHDTASQFGRDREGLGRSPQSHEHAEPGAFLLNAFGERLALDPGYLTFSTRTQVNKPEHHNVVLVDGAGPPDYLAASLQWLADLSAPPPAEGQSTISDTFDSVALDGATVSTRYRGAQLERRFLFVDDRYLVVADDVASPEGDHRLTWMLHGNGGGTSGGTFAPTPSGGRWEIRGARLDSGIAFADAEPTVSSTDWTHEIPYGQARTHTALAASTEQADPRALQVLYPSGTSRGAPEVHRLDINGAAGLEIVDPAEDRRSQLAWRGHLSSLTVGRGTANGSLLLVEETLGGELRQLTAEDASQLRYDGMAVLEAPGHGTRSLRLGGGVADLVVGSATGPATVRSLPFTPVAVDGACGFQRRPNGAVTVQLSDDPDVTLRATAGNGRPAADAGEDQRVEAGEVVALDGSASCDPEHQALVPRWELVSAPAGSAWQLEGAATWTPTLPTDRVGPYRVRLTVTDSQGARSNVSEVLVVAGARCGDGMDDDLDGLIDSDDPDCDAPAVDEARVFLLADRAGYSGTGPTDTLKVFRGASGEPVLFGGTMPVQSVEDGHPALLQLLVGRSGACWTGVVILKDGTLDGPRTALVSCRDFVQETEPDHLQGTAGAASATPLLFSFTDRPL